MAAGGKKKEALLASKLLSNILFVFDPSTLSYTVKNPVPALGTAVKLIDVTGKLMSFDAKQTKSAAKDVLSVTPGKHAIKFYNEVTDEK